MTATLAPMRGENSSLPANPALIALLSIDGLGYTAGPMSTSNALPGRLAKAQAHYEREFILTALKTHDGHNTRTAVWLGVSRRTLYVKLREHGLEGEASAMRTEAGIVGPRTRFVR